MYWRGTHRPRFDRDQEQLSWPPKSRLREARNIWASSVSEEEAGVFKASLEVHLIQIERGLNRKLKVP